MFKDRDYSKGIFFFILWQILISIGSVQGGNNAFELDTMVDPSFEPDYLDNFLAPDSEEYRNITKCPRLWHVKGMLEVLELWNHPGEEHNVTTEDGYIISMFRITPKKDNSTPILILHGFLAAPEIFLLRGKEDLPIRLADAGYDVWLASYRGGHYGRRHINLTTADEQFWDFSFHEHGYYDVPAMVDHILHTTGHQRISLIGHSMGNAAFMVMLAMRPHYNDKVQMFVGLAPYAVVRMQLNTRRKMLLPILVRLLKLVPVLVAYAPSGSSNKNLLHLLSIRNLTFLQYDYGPKENQVRYNSDTPPPYDLSNVRVPVSLYYGETDLLVTTKGIDAQVKALPNVVKTTIVKGYNHVDFLSARNTREVLYDPIIEDLKKYGT